MPSTGSKRKSGNATSGSDFKSRKAKVGKKATRALNDTDVSFRAASLYVSGQNVESGKTASGSGKDATATQLISSRGKTLQELTHQLATHPAGQARASAVKGINDIIAKNSIQNLHPSFSLIIPSLMHASVDSESVETRKLAVEGISMLIQKEASSNLLLPFAPLIVARISSALNSLDSSIRMNGVALIKVICEHAPAVCTETKQSASILTPFINLLAEHSTSSNGKDLLVLQSLTALLRVYASTDSGSESARTTNELSVDLVYVPGGRSRNAVLIPERPKRGPVAPLTSLSQLPFLAENAVGDSDTMQAEPLDRQPSKTTKNKSTDADTSLLSKLYDTLVEATDHMDANLNMGSEIDPTNTSVASENAKKNEKGSSNNNNQRIILVLSAVRWLDAYYHQTSDDASNAEFEVLKLKTLAFVMENVFGNIESDADDASSTNSVDFAIASTVLYVGGKSATAKTWMDRITDMVQQQLIRCRSAMPPELLDVTCQLVRSNSDDDASMLELLKELMLPSFMMGMSEQDAATMRTPTARRIILLAMEQLSKSMDVDDDVEAPGRIDNARWVYAGYVNLAPFCLEAWATDYLYESQIVLQTLLDVVRCPHCMPQQDNTDPSSSFVMAKLRESIGGLFGYEPSVTTHASMFELYPASLQRLVMALVAMLQSPTYETLKDMAAIVSRTNSLGDRGSGSVQIADLITESVHSIRKTISMTSYLTFLINTIGMPRRIKTLRAALTGDTQASSSSDMATKVIFSLDDSLTRIAKLLLSSGPSAARVFGMIQPQLISWQKSAVTVRDKSPLEYIMKMRACFVLMAFFFLAMQQQNGEGDIFESLSPTITLQSLEDMINSYLRCIIADDTPAMAMQSSTKLTSPLVAIMVAVPKLFEWIVLKMASEWFPSGHLSKAAQSNVLRILLEWLKDSRLRNTLLVNVDTTRTSLKDSIDAIAASDQIEDNEPAKQIVKDLLIQLELTSVL